MLQNTTHTLNSCGPRSSGANDARKKSLKRLRGDAARFCARARSESCSDNARVSYVSAINPDLLGKWWLISPIETPAAALIRRTETPSWPYFFKQRRVASTRASRRTAGVARRNFGTRGCFFLTLRGTPDNPARARSRPPHGSIDRHAH